MNQHPWWGVPFEQVASYLSRTSELGTQKKKQNTYQSMSSAGSPRRPVVLTEMSSVKCEEVSTLLITLLPPGLPCATFSSIDETLTGGTGGHCVVNGHGHVRTCSVASPLTHKKNRYLSPCALQHQARNFWLLGAWGWMDGWLARPRQNRWDRPELG